MEFQNPNMIITSHEEYIITDDEEDDEAGAPLPGFRFHPTDEELVTFYLKTKVEKKPFTFELIKQIDIYRYDPWDLIANVGNVGDKEWYFYCKRGRKYKNSMRPNRVTGSGGFWKATGIDRPIYESNGVFVSESRPATIVGLKKSLVYYRGKGTKTDWMMHELRLPLSTSSQNPTNPQLPEAEIWTVCRIFKRSRKYAQELKELSSKRGSISSNNKNNTCTSNNTSAQTNKTDERYISFSNPSTTIQAQQVQPRQNYDGIRVARRETEQQMIVEAKYVDSPTDPNHSHEAKTLLLDHEAKSPELASSFSSPLNTLTSLVYDQDFDVGNDLDDLLCGRF
ncbi:hypothetical protein V2J09_013613 [Rumex salicifolius]